MLLVRAVTLSSVLSVVAALLPMNGNLTSVTNAPKGTHAASVPGASRAKAAKVAAIVIINLEPHTAQHSMKKKHSEAGLNC